MHIPLIPFFGSDTVAAVWIFGAGVTDYVLYILVCSIIIRKNGLNKTNARWLLAGLFGIPAALIIFGAYAALAAWFIALIILFFSFIVWVKSTHFFSDIIGRIVWLFKVAELIPKSHTETLCCPNCGWETKVGYNRIKPPKGYGKKPKRVLPSFPYVCCSDCGRHLTIENSLGNVRGSKH
jgi:hypothetical protein